MKKLILYFLLGVTLVSCNLIPFPHSENIDYTYSDEKKPEFKRNDTIFFKNRVSGLKDTFVLSIFSDFHVNDNISYDQATYHYTPLNENLHYDNITVYLTNIDYKEHLIYHKGNTTVRSGYVKKQTLVSFTLNDQTYTLVDVLSHNDSTNADFIPNTIYFSCKYGILRYECLDGRVYEL